MGIFKRGGGDDKQGQEKHAPEKLGQWKEHPARPVAVAEPRVRAAHEGDASPNSIGRLMERVSLNSVQEIDRLIGDLERLKARLQNEANRIQGEIVGYATL